MTSSLALRTRESGTALICVLMVTTVLATLSAAAVLVTMTESLGSANYGAAQQALYAADAALEQTLGELRLIDWRTLPSGVVSAQLWDGASAPQAPGGLVLNLAQLSAARQADSDAVFGPSPDRPRWRLFGHAPFADLVPAGVVVSPAYLVVWVADDGDEEDGDPERDSNNVVMVRAEAFGIAAAHRSIEATLTLQTGPPGTEEEPPTRREVRLVAWREVR
jgi:hypothetical protein